ncbi:MAG: hypothetical protein QOK20_100, partial [Acidimicrobiaceae bacterium]|nr:hypothetical protein [Acidimicrobiaceae bacterium]
QKPPARSPAASDRSTTPDSPPRSSATRARPAPQPPSRTRAVQVRPPTSSPVRLDRTDQSSRRPGTTDAAAPAVRPRAGVGILLAIAVLGGGLLAAGGLPAPPPGQSVSDQVAAILDPPGGPQGSDAPPISAATTASAVRASQLGSGQAVTLAFGGDVHFEGPVAKRLSSNSHTVFNPAKPLYAGADITMVNLETAITNGGVAAPKQFVFRAPPTALTAIKAGGITLVTEANNHGEDYGAQGLADSIAASTRAGLPVIGIGENVAEAFAPYRATIKGQRIAIIAATHVLDDNLRDQWTATDSHPGLASAYDVDHLLAAVRQVRLTSDTVVVFLHWGVETQSCPTPAQEELAHQAVAAGADIVVGSHAHVLLGGGLMDGAMVSYGLGNFAFYATQPAQLESGVLRVTVTGRRIDAYRWAPARLSGGVATPLSGSSAKSALSRWSALRSCTDLDA